MTEFDPDYLARYCTSCRRGINGTGLSRSGCPLNKVLNSSKEALFVADENLEVIFTNNRFRTLFDPKAAAVYLQGKQPDAVSISPVLRLEPDNQALTDKTSGTVEFHGSHFFIFCSSEKKKVLLFVAATDDHFTTLRPAIPEYSSSSEDSSSDLRSVLSSSGEIFLKMNLCGDITSSFTGVPASRHFFCPAGPYTGKNISEVVPHEVSGRMFYALAETVISNRKIHLEIRTGCNGEMKYFMARFIPHEKEGVIAVIKEVTRENDSEKKAAYIKLLLKALWDYSPDGIRITDSNGIVLSVNRAYCRLTDADEKEVTGKPFYELFDISREDKQKHLQKYIECFRSRNFDIFSSAEIKLAAGRIVYFSMNYAFIYSSDPEPVLLTIFHDITKVKDYEKEVIKSERLITTGRMASYLSHQIKTPLTSIKMNLEMLGTRPGLNEHESRSLAIMNKEVRNLERLVKSVLLFSRRPDMIKSLFSLYGMIDDISKFMEPLLAKHNIRLINDSGGIELKGDYDKIRPVFLYLIENAIEAIGTDGAIEIKAFQAGGEVHIYIKDTGAGTELGNEIFEPFFTTRPGGSGLGLAIAKNIIRQHGGSISLLSSMPGETIFIITLPEGDR